MTKTRTDKQRIKAAFKNLRDQGIEATANFGSEKEISRYSRYREIVLGTRVYNFRHYDSPSVSNGLGADDNIEDPAGNLSSNLQVITSSSVSIDEVISALKAEGLFIDSHGERYISVLSHKQPEYENVRYDKGFESGQSGTSLPMVGDSPRYTNATPQYIEGWIVGAFDSIFQLNKEVGNDVLTNYKSLTTVLGKDEARKLTIPILESLVQELL